MPARSVQITPSILACDLAHLQDEVESVCSADWLQVDVMDGHFVPNLSFGAPLVRCLKTTLPLDIHLMVSNPADRIDEFLALHVANITFHAEAVQDPAQRRSLIQRIRAGNATAGIALKPATPVSAIADVLSEVDLVLVMSVEPGFSGQAFLPQVLGKVEEIHRTSPATTLQMDGGIDAQTAPLCTAKGAMNLVVGSSVFGAQNRPEMITLLRGL
jgi:ribulose-phosphate 3-epimerase